MGGKLVRQRFHAGTNFLAAVHMPLFDARSGLHSHFCLNRILSNVKTGAVFTAGTVKMLRVISYCCFAAAVIFAVLGIWRLLALLLCFAAAFVGLLLRVLKNVFQQAVLIREENDFTI